MAQIGGLLYKTWNRGEGWNSYVKVTEVIELSKKISSNLPTLAQVVNSNAWYTYGKVPTQLEYCIIYIPLWNCCLRHTWDNVAQAFPVWIIVEEHFPIFPFHSKWWCIHFLGRTKICFIFFQNCQESILIPTSIINAFFFFVAQLAFHSIYNQKANREQ